MTTCMETWIVVRPYDATGAFRARTSGIRSACRSSTWSNVRRNAIQNALIHATRNCSNAYAKGERSFELLGKLDPEALDPHFPSFRRLKRILNDRL